MNRAEATLAYVDTLEGITADEDLLRYCARTRRVAFASQDMRLISAVVMLPSEAEPVDLNAYNELAEVAADICEDYSLEPEEMVTVFEMCEDALQRGAN